MLHSNTTYALHVQNSVVHGQEEDLQRVLPLMDKDPISGHVPGWASKCAPGTWPVKHNQIQGSFTHLNPLY